MAWPPWPACHTQTLPRTGNAQGLPTPPPISSQESKCLAVNGEDNPVQGLGDRSPPWSQAHLQRAGPTATVARVCSATEGQREGAVLFPATTEQMPPRRSACPRVHFSLSQNTECPHHLMWHPHPHSHVTHEKPTAQRQECHTTGK